MSRRRSQPTHKAFALRVDLGCMECERRSRRFHRLGVYVREVSMVDNVPPAWEGREAEWAAKAGAATEFVAGESGSGVMALEDGCAFGVCLSCREALRDDDGVRRLPMETLAAIGDEAEADGVLHLRVTIDGWGNFSVTRQLPPAARSAS